MDWPRRRWERLGARRISEWELRSSLLCCWSGGSLRILCGWLRGRLLLGRWLIRLEKVDGLVWASCYEVGPHLREREWIEIWVTGPQFCESDLALMQCAVVCRTSLSLRRRCIQRRLLVGADLLDNHLSSRWHEVARDWSGPGCLGVGDGCKVRGRDCGVRTYRQGTCLFFCTCFQSVEGGKQVGVRLSGSLKPAYHSV